VLKELEEKKLHLDEKTEQQTDVCGRDKFRVETFYVIFFKTSNQLEKRKQ